MAPSRVRMAEMLEGVSETGVHRLLDDCMQNPDADVIEMLQQAESAQDETVRDTSTRGVTGARAEDLFVEWFESGQSIFDAPLKDCRQLQCGYDFEATFNGDVVFVEVKGLKGQTGGVLLTDKEWSVANDVGDKYFIVIVRCVDSVEPRLEVFRDPANALSASQNVTTVVQVSWIVDKVDASIAIWSGTTN